MAEPPRRPANRWLAPAVVFLALGILIVAQILTAPHDETLESRPRLSSRSALPYGARGVYETLERLGWRASRRVTPFRETLDSTALYVVLEGIVPISGVETHQLLEAVRRGATMLVTASRGSSLADSLGMRASERTFGTTPAGPGGLGAPEGDEDERSDAGSAISARPALAATADSATLEELASAARDLTVVRGYLQPLDSAERRRVPFPRDTASFVTARLVNGDTVPVILGVRWGRGRLVAVGDPYLLSNRVMRDGDAAVLLVRAVEWLAPERHTPVVFDEYHHSPETASGPGVVRRAMLQTPLGRAATQLLVAATLVILALGARPLAPRPRMRLERRSPFEHVGALARAYQQVRATRTASRRLLQGLRRRHPIGRGTVGEEAYLGALAARYPEVTPEIERLRGALQRALGPEEFLAVGQGIETIERKIES